MSDRYWHGGVRGLKPGDFLVPPNQHGGQSLHRYAERCEDSLAKEALRRGDRVFITTSKRIARAYAQAYVGGGALYQVRGWGTHELDHDCPDGTSFMVPKAEIVAVYDAFVETDIEKAVRTLARAS